MEPMGGSRAVSQGSLKPSPITESNEIGKPSDECDVGLLRYLHHRTAAIVMSKHPRRTNYARLFKKIIKNPSEVLLLVFHFISK